MRNTIIAIFFSCLCMGLSAQTSFTVEEAIQYAMQRSASLKLKQIDIEDAGYEINRLRSMGLPTVNGNVNYQYFPAVPAVPLEDFITPIVIGVLNNTVSQGMPIPFPEPQFFEFSFVTKNNLSGTLEANSLIFDGSFFAALKAAKLYRTFVEEGVAITEQEIRINVTKAYLGVLILEKNKETIAKNIKNLERTYFEMSEMYKEGFIEKLDVQRIELTLSVLRSEAEKLIQVENLSKNLLKFQMDYPLMEDIQLSEDLESSIALAQIDEVNLEAGVDFNLRPEYRQIKKGLELQEVNMERLKKTNWPSLSAFGSVGQSLQRNKLFDSDEGDWLPNAVVGLNLNIPIYDGGLRKAEIGQARLENERVLIELENFEKAVALQVQNARIQFINAKTSVENAEFTLALTEEIYKTTQIKFREGVGSSIESTQAEASLFDAQSNYISALYDLLNAKTDLDIAMGKL